MSAEKGRASQGLTFWGALQLLFIGLKLTGYIDWSWWVVFWPLWVDLVVLGACFLVIGIITYIEMRK